MIDNKFKEDFKEAIFETIRLWCTSEYFFSASFKKACNDFKETDKKITKDFSEVFQKFLSDYSIARTRLKDMHSELIKEIFKQIKGRKFEAKMVDDIAIILKDGGFTPQKKSSAEALLPTSLVSKALFLFCPEKAIMYDSRGVSALKKIYFYKEKPFKLNDSILYENYYNYFNYLKEDNDKMMQEIAKEFIDKYGESMKEYWLNIDYKNSTWRYKKVKSQFPFDEKGFFKIFDINFLIHRSLDKYLWLYYEKYLKKNKNNNENEDEDE